ncbi:GNAT family N-acetyltransferase [Streptomyces polyrhachis]|uniref:GNAT family N-acetyltransferase n=1 Tax=Streptomyces polyrhachis TaxID=1282885 RepID=A0ABW2GRA9_9ACTN
MDYVIRGSRADEWRQVRELRLAALQDEAAGIAFLESYEDGLRHPDEFWQERAAGAAAGERVKGFIAEDVDGRWVGSVTVLVELPGDEGLFGEEPEQAQGHLVGVYLRPEARGAGLGEALFEAAVEWAFAQERPRLERVRLFVHERNGRASGLYRKCGFVPTGKQIVLTKDGGQEIEMVRGRA